MAGSGEQWGSVCPPWGQMSTGGSLLGHLYTKCKGIFLEELFPTSLIPFSGSGRQWGLSKLQEIILHPAWIQPLKFIVRGKQGFKPVETPLI